MKILYFGTVCDLQTYNRMLQACSVRPSVASIVLESAMLQGFRQNGADVEIHGFPQLPTFPKNRRLFYGGFTEQLPCGYACRWLRTVNIPVLKQVSRRLDARWVMRQWARKNRVDGVIFTYSIPPFMAKDVIRYAKKYGVKTVTIIPDLLRDMYVNEDPRSWLTRLKKRYIQPALKVQGEYDGYIYLTEAMRDVVAPGKPYMVMEGIANPEMHPQPTGEKAVPRAIMYAGMLHRKYGVMNLVEAFEQLADPSLELWLFGEGNAAAEIQARAKKNPRIHDYGMLPHARVLEYERKATLLVNPRDPQEAFTRYSFPSKTIEYMLSGTPVLTTKLPGIPRDYDRYVYTAENAQVDTLREALTQILSCSQAELNQKGAAARAYVINHKNAVRQAERMIGFIHEVQEGSADPR